jgi:hypothetical protein
VSCEDSSHIQEFLVTWRDSETSTGFPVNPQDSKISDRLSVASSRSKTSTVHRSFWGLQDFYRNATGPPRIPGPLRDLHNTRLDFETSTGNPRSFWGLQDFYQNATGVPRIPGPLRACTLPVWISKRPPEFLVAFEDCKISTGMLRGLRESLDHFGTCTLPVWILKCPPEFLAVFEDCKISIGMLRGLRESLDHFGTFTLPVWIHSNSSWPVSRHQLFSWWPVRTARQKCTREFPVTCQDS